MSSVHIGMHFAVPIIQARFEAPRGLNTELLDLCLSWEKSGTYKAEEPVPTNQINIYESEWNFLEVDNHAVKELRQFILRTLLPAVAHLNGYTQSEAARLKPRFHSWFHVTSKGGYISHHNHPNASWSGIYFVSPGEKPSDFSDSGRVKFLTPNPGVKMHRDRGNGSLKGPFSQNTFVIEPEVSKLVLFPSHLMHEVSPFMGQDKRVTIAFNCWFD
ncbi:TIGR02466 family protein [Corallincola platygyrae]|uniref:TIGR02466 family protein n=1 Tax=Corallincola platygyrae TaxID=1193278 RepID=A0ABW4XTB0_9GAMM